MNKIDLYIPGIKKINILSNLSETEIKELLEFAVLQEAEENEVIFNENDYGTSIYMLIYGSVKICKMTETGVEYEITRMNETEFFGEMSFLDNSVRSAKAIAISRAVMISLDEELFKRFSHRYSYAAFRFLKNISIESQKRLRQTNEKLLKSYEALLKTHNELVENRNFLYNVIRSSSEIIIILDKNLNIYIFNSGAEKELQVCSANAIKKSAAHFFCENNYSEIIDELLKGNDIYNKDIYLRCIDGRKILTNFSAFTIKSSNKSDCRPQAIVMIASNITQKKLLERQLFQNEKMIFLGKIISEIIHDIKNPLASITSAITGLQNSQTPGNAQTDKEINDINQAASLIHGVILKTLGLVKVVPAGHNVIDLNAVVARSADWCKNNAKIKNREIIFEKPPEKALISGNEPQLEQVFINLISNALNAVEEKKDGKVKIEIETCGSLISCSIEDNGRGMDEETLNNIFDPSFNTARSGNSSGIGLCICQAILSQHNASINCRSKLNEGSIFTVDFSRAGRNKL